MKKKHILFIGLLLISGLTITLVNACDKDTFCYLDVTVNDLSQNGAAPDSCWVLIYSDKGNITDTQLVLGGANSYTFRAPAIFNVKVRTHVIDTMNFKEYYFRQGSKAIRLKEAERVSLNVKVESQRLNGNDPEFRVDNTATRADFRKSFPGSPWIK